MAKKAKTEVDKKFENKLNNVLKHVRQMRETAVSIAKDHAVNVADALNREDEKGIKERNEQYVNYRIWEARAAVYKAIEEQIVHELHSW